MYACSPVFHLFLLVNPSNVWVCQIHLLCLLLVIITLVLQFIQLAVLLLCTSVFEHVAVWFHGVLFLKKSVQLIKTWLRSPDGPVILKLEYLDLCSYRISVFWGVSLSSRKGIQLPPLGLCVPCPSVCHVKCCWQELLAALLLLHWNGIHPISST